MSRYRTELEAVRAWIEGWNSIPVALIARAFNNASEDLVLLGGGNKQSMCCDAEVDSEGRGDDTAPRCSSCNDVLDEDDIVWSGAEYGYPAAWGTMFHPGESIDEDWIRQNVETVVGCGFLVYECDEVGILLGIDGAGYNFFAQHWIPLYRARGLRWHEEDDLPDLTARAQCHDCGKVLPNDEETDAHDHPPDGSCRGCKLFCWRVVNGNMCVEHAAR